MMVHVGLSMWGTMESPSWLAGTVESVRERQEGLASPGRLVAASYN
jgi:hypothetical protein